MNSMNRRQFLKTAAVTAGVTIVPRHVLGGPGFVAPSDTLNIAGIGCGGQGGGDLGQMSTENIVALCDVDWERAAKTFAKYPDVPRYKDFRIMLEKQKDIDAVTVGTPDHFHAVAALAAIQLGKHVFVEKPLTHTVSGGARAGQGRPRGQGRHPDGQPGARHGEHPPPVRMDLGRRHRQRHRSPCLDAPPGLAARHGPARRHASRARDARLGHLARARALPAVSSRLPARPLARLAGFRDGRPGRHGLPHLRPHLLVPEARRPDRASRPAPPSSSRGP